MLPDISGIYIIHKLSDVMFVTLLQMYKSGYYYGKKATSSVLVLKWR